MIIVLAAQKIQNIVTKQSALFRKIDFFENLVDFNEALLHEATLNLHMHLWIFSRLLIASVDGKQHFNEVVFSALARFSLQGK